MGALALQEVFVMGKESAGKSELIASLSGRHVYASNFRGSTVSCAAFRSGDLLLIDSPGIQRAADTDAMKEALAQLNEADRVLLVLPAAHVRDDLRDLLPLVQGKSGAVVLTFWDRLGENDRAGLLRSIEGSGLRVVPVDARSLSSEQNRQVHAALVEPPPFELHSEPLCAEPPVTVSLPDAAGPSSRTSSRLALWAKALVAIASVLLPGYGVVWVANGFAGWLDPFVQAAAHPLAQRFDYPLLTGNYGLITMGPLLFVWAAPVVILYALVLALYKTSGLIDIISDYADPLLRGCGLSGRDLPRILMGFGCNVPAVIGTRSCGTSSRNTCISTIAFGSACSYQFGATLGVFNAVRRPNLVLPYLAYLGLTTLVYARWVSGRSRNRAFNILLAQRRTTLSAPRWKAVVREAWGSIRAFFVTSLPIFFGITLLASLLDMTGLLNRAAGALSPAMATFHLPASAALGILLASIRKDGLLLLSRTPMTGLQVLTAVYLAGVLLPCLVTLLTIARERSVRFALTLAGRQMAAACIFALALAWLGRFFS